MLTFLLLLVSRISADVYSSFENVKNINHIENHLVKLLGEYIAADRARLNTLETFQQYVIDSKQYTDPDEYISYPTNQFNVIHRFAADWNNLDKWMDSQNAEIANAYDTYRSHFPDDSDLKGAVKAIHRLQDMYKISAGHFARGDPLGTINDTIRGQPFNVKALYVFTKNAYDSEDYKKCAGWGQQAFHQLQTLQEYTPQSSMWFDVSDHFAFCLYKIGNVEHAMEVTDEMLRYHPTHERLLSNKAYFQESFLPSLGETPGVEKRSVITDPPELLNLHEISGPEEVPITYVPKIYPGADQVVLSEEEIERDIEDRYYQFWSKRVRRYKRLCKEQAPLTPEIKEQIDQLTCFYKQDTPGLILKPIKVEVVWPSPRITIFYDLVDDYEANYIMKLAQPLLNRATVHNKETGKLENAEYRVSKTAWLDIDIPADTEKIVKRLNRRMEDATELSHEYAELQQVNNYGMAGQYEPHYDMATADEKAFTDHDGGNRVATLLFYMGDTDAGGATVFIDGGARISPVKNAAVFWYNLLPNGNPDLLTRHAGCPVLAGTKWVMNKWFHVNDQMFIRRCDLDENRREKTAKLYDGRYTT